MRRGLVCVLALGLVAAAPITEQQAGLLCSLNPAASEKSLRAFVPETRAAYPELGRFSDGQIAHGAAGLAIRQCATRMVREPAAFDLLQSYRVNDDDWQAAWDAWNLACADSRNPASCIRREVGHAPR